MATTNKKVVKQAINGNFLWNSNGIATRFEILRKIQFSILRLAKSHIPAHAVEETNASSKGTSESV